jgi:hypothetical protein
MRKSVFTLTAATALLAGEAMLSGPAGAMTLGSPEGVRGALDTINPVEQAGCWRYGWHGWGWYPFCGRPYGRGYGYGPGWGYGPRWGWHHRGHRWHHW